MQIWWRNQKLSGQTKVKRIQHHQPALQQMLKELLEAGDKEKEKTYRLTPGELNDPDTQASSQINEVKISGGRIQASLVFKASW